MTVVLQRFPAPIVVTASVGLFVELSAIPIEVTPPVGGNEVSVPRLTVYVAVKAPTVSADAVLTVPRLSVGTSLPAPVAKAVLAAVYPPRLDLGVLLPAPTAILLEPDVDTLVAPRLDIVSVLPPPSVEAQPVERAVPRLDVAVQLRAPVASAGVAILSPGRIAIEVRLPASTLVVSQVSEIPAGYTKLLSPDGSQLLTGIDGAQLYGPSGAPFASALLLSPDLNNSLSGADGAALYGQP